MLSVVRLYDVGVGIESVSENGQYRTLYPLSIQGTTHDLVILKTKENVELVKVIIRGRDI